MFLMFPPSLLIPAALRHLRLPSPILDSDSDSDSTLPAPKKPKEKQNLPPFVFFFFDDDSAPTTNSTLNQKEKQIPTISFQCEQKLYSQQRPWPS